MPELFRDPWAKREAWRKHPLFSMRFYARNMFPGLGLGSAAFVAYLFWEKYSADKKALHH
ncbi:hypothetical protein MOBT1_003292 [Malassezia obtusa]|uniref:NADH dehydrogenase [ubiquinone] 1 beta subcomplex subunit 3 n=1 Tax=Malassezia obtusa TaxID=76774 RepID=A0AAF0ITB6_9BASI|nr:hypothetical protein MOBT1_003292 [Malassezia obtusa]